MGKAREDFIFLTEIFHFLFENCRNLVKIFTSRRWRKKFVLQGVPCRTHLLAKRRGRARVRGASSCLKIQSKICLVNARKCLEKTRKKMGPIPVYPTSKFFGKNRQILKIGKTGTRGFWPCRFRISYPFSDLGMSKACMRHLYQDYVNFTKIIKLIAVSYFSEIISVFCLFWY